MLESIKGYFFPQPLADWDSKSVREVNKRIGLTQDLSKILLVIGAIGSLISGSFMLVRAIRATQILTPRIVKTAITSIALLALGYFLKRLVASHYQGLTRAKRVEIAVEEIKEGFKELTVCKDQKELEDKLENDPHFNFSVARRVIKDTNTQIINLAKPCYQPTKEVRPRYEIETGLTNNQKQELLDVAYAKGIVLRFIDFHENVYGKMPFRAVFGDFGDAKKVAEMINAFKCSIKFLENRLPLKDKGEIELINDQLRALCFRFRDIKNERNLFFNPTLYLEDDQTLIIRGNCGEIGNIEWAIEPLAKFFPHIKIEKVGINSLQDLDLWERVQKDLNDRFPGQLTFIDRLPNMPDIWQDTNEYGWRDYSIKEIATIGMEDLERIGGLETKKKTATESEGT